MEDTIPRRKRTLVLILDWSHPLDQQGRLNSHGGRLLKWILARHSIPREAWAHNYCHLGNKRDLPKRKQDRLVMLEPDRERMTEFLQLHQPATVVGLGRLACEFFTGASVLSTRAGADWWTPYGIVWIAHSPDAAVLDPNLTVDIAGVIIEAAGRAGIKTKFDRSVPAFNWGAAWTRLRRPF